MVSMTKDCFRDLLERTAGITTQVFVFKKTGAAFLVPLTTIKPGPKNTLHFFFRC
jgi:hypothetical protein